LTYLRRKTIAGELERLRRRQPSRQEREPLAWNPEQDGNGAQLLPLRLGITRADLDADELHRLDVEHLSAVSPFL
jgi:hypothetical protein